MGAINIGRYAILCGLREPKYFANYASCDIRSFSEIKSMARIGLFFFKIILLYVKKIRCSLLKNVKLDKDIFSAELFNSSPRFSAYFI